MNLLEIFRVAWRALLRNKTRSFLTTLGIVIGVTAVIAMVTIGDGAKARVQQTFEAMGSNMLILLPGTTTHGGMGGGFGSLPTVTWDDLRAIQTELAAVRYVSPNLRAAAPVVAEDQNWTTSIFGVGADYFQIRNWGTATGSLFGTSDVDAGSKVVLIGQTVATQLYGEGIDPVGRTVRIKGVPFTVVGMLESKGQSAMGQDFDDSVFVPYSTFLAKIQSGLKNVIAGAVMIGADSAENTRKAEEQVRALLRDRHHLPEGTDDDFSIRNLTEMASGVEQGTRTMTLLLAAIAAVSLLVGGIGIMNIMLVSVTERTREIGVRMAVGARQRDILLQFLVESLTLAATGGAVGVALGLGGAIWLASSFGWPILVRPGVIVIAVTFSALVGVGFGLYPARKASKLDPIQALRFE
ncbi:MAG TPA: ABC transporter permease [Anaeromyxobacteraceae bacterium]|nr:ABC transporter permease [Anaeromyxobacteraceae bacterium]